MRCKNCDYKLNKSWKVCPNCGNKVEIVNLPFKSKNKEWIDKHLLLVNIFYCLPVNLLYTLLPAYLVYWGFNEIGMASESNDMIKSMLYMLGYSALFPILLMVFFVIFVKCYVKSFKMVKYASGVTNDKRYYYFIISDVVGLVIALIVYFFFIG